MKILVLQTGRYEHCVAAAHAAAARYPGAALVCLCKPADRRRIESSGLFAEVLVDPDGTDQAGARLLDPGPVELWVIPFQDRFGIRYWHARRRPLQFGAPRIASFNRLGRWREAGRRAWAVQTALVCLGLRALQAPALRLWMVLRRGLDVGGLFLLTGLALGLNVMRRPQRLLWRALGTGVAEQGPRRLRLFIPSLGMGGAQRQLVTFLAALDRRRWQPEVLTLDMPDKFFEPAVRRLDVPVIYLNRGPDFWMLGVVWRLVRHLAASPGHVLHSWLHYAVMLGAVAGSLAGAPVIVGSLRSERPARFPWFYPGWQRAMDLLTAPLQTRLIANSHAVRDDNRRWARIPDHKLVTVYNGVAPDDSPPDPAALARLRRDLQLEPGVRLVGIVGRLYPEKDHATFLRAARAIADVEPNLRFLIVGDGCLREAVARDVQTLELGDRVSMLGERQDARLLIRLLDVLVLTSTSEGFPNVLLEAMAAGTAVVTTAAGGAAEAVVDGDSGFVVPCGEPSAVAERILTLLRDEARRLRMTASARTRVQEVFSAGRMVEGIEACYGAESGAAEPGQGRRSRVCFVSPYAYGFLRPSSGLPIGGAEVQVGALALALSQDPRFRVTVLAGTAGMGGREQEGRLAVWLTKLLPVSRRRDVAPADVLRQDRAPDLADGSPAGRAKRWLNRQPPAIAACLRGVVRFGYACRRAGTAIGGRPWRWMLDRWREMLTVLRWWHLLRRVGADVYVLRCASPLLGHLALCCRWLDRRLIYMAASEEDVSGAYAESRGVWGRRFEWGLRRSEVVVCQHADQAALLRRRYHRDGLVIPSLCPVPLRSRTGGDRSGLLWVGRIDANKQVELFLRLAEVLTEESFVLVGALSDPLSTDLQAWWARLSRLPNLTWHQSLPFAAMPDLFARAKVLLNTSRMEGFPNTFLQAAASGTPVVSWRVNPEGILDRYAFGCCAGGDWARFEQQVRVLCRDERERERLGANGRRYLQARHDPEVILRQHADLLLSDGAPRASLQGAPASTVSSSETVGRVVG